MPRRGENIFKRKDGRWEARYVKEIALDGKKKYGSVYANLKHIRFHDLRHSCASLLVSFGFSMKDVQEWLGHADYTLTANTYSHVDMSEKVKMANQVNDSLTFQSEAPDEQD